MTKRFEFTNPPLCYKFIRLLVDNKIEYCYELDGNTQVVVVSGVVMVNKAIELLGEV